MVLRRSDLKTSVFFGAMHRPLSGNKVCLYIYMTIMPAMEHLEETELCQIYKIKSHVKHHWYLRHPTMLICLMKLWFHFRFLIESRHLVKKFTEDNKKKSYCSFVFLFLKRNKIMLPCPDSEHSDLSSSRTTNQTAVQKLPRPIPTKRAS